MAFRNPLRRCAGLNVQRPTLNVQHPEARAHHTAGFYAACLFFVPEFSSTRMGEVDGAPPDSVHLFPNQHQQSRNAPQRNAAACSRGRKRPPETGAMALPGRTLPNVSRTQPELPSGRVVLRSWGCVFIGLHS